MADNEIIPLIPDYDYDQNSFLEGLNVQFRFRWNFTDNAWYADLTIIDTGTILKGIKLIGGTELLRPYAVTELGKMYIVDTEGQFTEPNFDDIGDRFKLLYIPKENADDFFI